MSVRNESPRLPATNIDREVDAGDAEAAVKVEHDTNCKAAEI
jgi:hypothetical protein